MFLSFYVRLVMVMLSIQALNTQDSIAGTTDDSEAEGILREYCPSNYCGFNASLVNGTSPNKACCVPCDCSDQCFELGTCCYDQDQSSRPQQPDVELGVCTQTSIGNNYVLYDSGRFSYMLYQYCSNTKNERDVSQCLEPVGNTIDELLPVYSHRTERHYRNIYCAKCNNDQAILTKWAQKAYCTNNIELWLLYIDKSQNKPKMNFVTEILSGNANCVLHFSPPNDLPATRCLHHRDMVSNCNPQHESYEEWKYQCENYYSPVYQFNTLYKNVFCIMCNIGRQYILRRCANSDSLDDKMTQFAVTALLNYDYNYASSRSVVKSYDEERCNPPYEYNAQVNACLKMKCPLTMFPTGGKCFAPFESFSKINLDFRISVTFSRFIPYKREDVMNEAFDLLEHIHQSCYLCKSATPEVIVHPDTIEVIVQLIVEINKPVNLYDLYKQYLRNIEKHNAKPSVIYKMAVKRKPLATPTGDYVFLAPFSDALGERCESIAMSDMLFCPLVVLNVRTMLKDGSVSTEGVLFRRYEFIENTQTNGTHKEIFVCLDTYLSKMKSIASANMDIQRGNASKAFVQLVSISMLLFSLIAIRLSTIIKY